MSKHSKSLNRFQLQDLISILNEEKRRVAEDYEKYIDRSNNLSALDSYFDMQLELSEMISYFKYLLSKK